MVVRTTALTHATPAEATCLFRWSLWAPLCRTTSAGLISCCVVLLCRLIDAIVRTDEWELDVLCGGDAARGP